MKTQKPPIGYKPLIFDVEDKLDVISKAIKRYINAGHDVPSFMLDDVEQLTAIWTHLKEREKKAAKRREEYSFKH